MDNRLAASADSARVEGDSLAEVLVAGLLLAVSLATVFGAPLGFAALSWMAFVNPATFGVERDVGLYCAGCSLASLVLPAGLVGLLWVEATAPTVPAPSYAVLRAAA
jgi:predicted metal-binding membrane protein